VATTAPAQTGSGNRLLRIQGLPLGRWLRTTPGRFRLVSLGLVLALVVTLVATTAAVNARAHAAHTAGQQAVPELRSAVRLYAALADADATATIVFLQAGLENPALRQRYLDDLREAGDELAVLARQVGSSSGDRHAVATISDRLPKYSGMVETARANIRQGFPVGASYLREASQLMGSTMLPQAKRLYERAAGTLDDNYRSGTSDIETVVVAVLGVIALGLLVVAQVFLTRRTNRVLNVPIVAATAVLVVVLGWVLLRFVSAQDSLVRAQRNGSDTVQLLSAGRILALQAQSDEDLVLSERGSANDRVADFDALMKRLGGTDGSGGLLGDARVVASRRGDTGAVDEARRRFRTVMGQHTAVRTADDDSRYIDAVHQATTTEAEAFTALDRSLRSEIAAAQRRLEAQVADAQRGFDVLTLAVPLLLLLAAALVLVGFQRRIAEYR
jgi:hypothetical protein